MKAGSEHSFQYSVVRMLRANGFLVIDTDVMDALKYLGSHNDRRRFSFISHHKNMGYTNGQSDLIVGNNGHFWALELKTATGKQSQDQKLFQVMCERRGLSYRIIRSFQDVDEFIKEVDKLGGPNENTIHKDLHSGLVSKKPTLNRCTNRQGIDWDM